MKKTTKVLKIAALVIAVALIGMISFIINAFVGNPISSALADKGIKEYVHQEYSHLDLEVEQARTTLSLMNIWPEQSLNQVLIPTSRFIIGKVK